MTESKSEAPVFIDAEAMHRKHPDSFNAPSVDPRCLDEIRKLTTGDFVKVCTNDERFWAEITARFGSKFTAVVDNRLLNDGLECGDQIEVEERHIYDYMRFSPNYGEMR